MKFLILVGILVLTITISVAIVIALYRHKKASSETIDVMGKTGTATSDLTPEGTVLVYGELWRARSRDGSSLVSETQVRVVSVEGHLLVVEPHE